MEYQIQVKELIIEKNKMTLTVMGSIADPSINSHFLSNPKLVMHFDNGKEDRRIPFVLTNVTHIDGKVFFSGKYIYTLNYLFWKTRNSYKPFNMYFNLGFADFYEEKINVDLTPELLETDDRNYRIKINGNRYDFYPNRRRIVHTPAARFIVGLVNTIVKIIEFGFAILMFPLFIIEAILRFTGVLLLPARFNDESPVRRFIAYVFWRFSRVSTTDLSLWKVKRYIFCRCYDFYSIFKIKENKITFISLRRDDLSGNFAFVYDKLKDDKSLDINFILNDHTITEMTFGEILKFTKACATSKIVILDEFTPQIHYITERSRPLALPDFQSRRVRLRLQETTEATTTLQSALRTAKSVIPRALVSLPTGLWLRVFREPMCSLMRNTSKKREISSLRNIPSFSARRLSFLRRPSEEWLRRLRSILQRCSISTRFAQKSPTITRLSLSTIPLFRMFSLSPKSTPTG